MSKLIIISKEKHIRYMSMGNSLAKVDADLLIRPQTKEAHIIANDARLAGL